MTNKNEVYIIEDWFYSESFGKDEDGSLKYKQTGSMPRVFSGENSKKNAVDWMNKMFTLNDMEKCKPCWNKELAYRTRPICVSITSDEQWWNIYQMYELPERNIKIG